VRVLLDGCVPRLLGKELPGFEVRTAPELSLGDFDDGPLLDRIEGLFDVLVTVDKNIRKQQRLDHRSFGIIVLRGRTNRLADLLPLVEALRRSLLEIQPGEIRELGLAGPPR
jgi:hypothetical protein